ncbi:MAG: Hsp20/alpha crystallin family protein [Desulfovibrio sp.]|jgi:HSP20 family protein|nr:Hsp20/alpha crystallin family protein [Desulfovibrio sp.]
MQAIAITSPNRIWRSNFLADPIRPVIPDFSRFTGVDRFFDVILDGLSLHNTSACDCTKGTFRPFIDIRSDDKQYVINVEIPGIDENNLSVEVKDNELVISGEKKDACQAATAESEAAPAAGFYTERVYGSFTRTLTLPEDVDESAIAADHKNGLLTIILPRKAQEQPLSRSITVNRQ